MSLNPSPTIAAAIPSAAATPQVVSQSQTPVPVPTAARDTIASSSPAAMNATPARTASLTEKISKGASYVIAAPMILSLMPLMLFVRLLSACAGKKDPNAPETIRLINENRRKRDKEWIMNFVERRIKKEIEPLNAAERARFKETLRHVNPDFYAKPFVAGIVGAGEWWKEQPGIFNEALRILRRTFVAITTVGEHTYIPFPKAMEPFSTELMTMKRRFDSLPKELQQQYLAKIFRPVNDLPSSAEASNLLTDARELGARMVEEIPAHNFQTHIEDAVRLYLTNNP